MATARVFTFPNLTPGRYRLPSGFQLVPDAAPGLLSVPVTPVIPPLVATGDIITAVHENAVRQALNDLWTDVQYLDTASANAVPNTRRVNAGAGMTGGGALSADVTLNANVKTVFGRTGDVALTAADISGAGGVPATRQIIAGGGMTGGGALTGDVTLNANVRTVFGRAGDVVLTSADINTAGGVPATRQVLAGAGLTGGGALSADVTLAVVNDTSTQKHRVSLDGTLKGTRQEVNFVTGSNVTFTVTDDGPNNRINVQIASTGGGGGTNGHAILDEGNPLTQRAGLNFVGAGVVATDDAANNRTVVTIPSGIAVLDEGNPLTMRPTLNFVGAGVTATDDNANNRTLITIPGGGAGSQTPWTSDIDAAGFRLTTLAASGKDLIFAPNATERMRLLSGGGVGIGTATPNLQLQVNGVFGIPATSGTSQTGIARFSQVTNSSVLDVGFGGSPGAAWLQATNSADLSVKYPIVLNPNGGYVGIGTGANTLYTHLHVMAPATPLWSEISLGTPGNAMADLVVSGGAAAGFAMLTANLRYDGGQWNRWNTGQDGWMIQMIAHSNIANSSWNLYHTLGGANPVSTLTPYVTVLGSNGYVGINNTSPTSPLHLGNPSPVVGGTTNMITFQDTGAADNVYHRIGCQPYTGSTKSAINFIQNSAANFASAISFETGGNFERMRIDDTGRISMPSMPSANPGAGTKMLWYDPADSNRVKFAS